MVSKSPPLLYLPIFAGQGTVAATTSQTRHTALVDASSHSGSDLLSACHEAFHNELSSLSTLELIDLNIDLADFSKPEDLLALPPKRYQQNAVVSGTTLLLIQALRYLALVEETGVSTGSLTPFSDILKLNSEHGLGVLGFSSGILPACVAGTSFSTFSFVSRAVEAFRLALWVGVRAQFYRKNTVEAKNLDSENNLPWSLVFTGITKEDAEKAIITFTEGRGADCLYITAVVDSTCITISGRPDILALFADFVTTDKLVVHTTTLDTLYHSPIHTHSTRLHVLRDVVSRNIRFPTFSDIKVPIRSTFTGDAITKSTTSGSLLEHVVDMLLTQPVNWNVVSDKVAKALPTDVPIQLLNLGPGAGLARIIERILPQGRVSVVDCSISGNGTRRPSQSKQEPIAIIGMAVNMPGAPNVSKLWEIIEKGINTVSEIPEHRFRVSDYSDGSKSGRTMKAHTGNFIDGVDEFDNKFFKISPREARSMDPQQRILLHTAYEALEDSGYVPNATPSFRPENFGCYIGVATHDYIQNLRDEIDVYYSPGTLKAFLSGRISYAMQLSGPSIVVDTACSSSNVALYQGARALMNRDCDAALVGGVNVISSPDMFMGLDRGHFLSPTGQCKAFDASADGYSRSEGCGVFVIKRLADALAENDHILGVIRGIEVNQSGLAHSITHPHAPTQAALFKRVLENSNIEPGRVNVVEAHGTGTQAGDPNELESIRSVFCVQRAINNPLHITSVKANLGHLEAASGAAGLAKLLLMFQHRFIPRQISLKELNPRIAPLESDNTVIDTINTPWLPSHHNMPRIALLNNFGAAGSNTALLVEEHITPHVAAEPEGMHYMFGLSAKDETALNVLRSKYLEFLDDFQGLQLSDIAYTSTARRQIYDYRLSVSANNIKDLAQKLRKALVVQVTPRDARVVFVFSGQGGQYLGMGRELYNTSALFRKHIDDCHRTLVENGFPGILAIIMAGPSGSGLSSLEEFEAYQASIFSLECALAQLWISWGLIPTALIGHSLGEYAALVVANVLSIKDALLIVANRVRLMVKKCAIRTTGMIAVNMGPVAVNEALGTSADFSGLSIACYNSPIDCVVSGPLSQLAAFKAHLDASKCKNVLLTVPFGYHSEAMTPLLVDLTDIARGVTFRPPTMPIVSNVYGELVLPGDSSVFNAEYFSRHCAEPVQFSNGLQALLGSAILNSVDVWIEIGPHATTLPMLKSNPNLSRDSILLSSLRRQQDAWITLTSSLSQLYAHGLNVNWRQTFAHVSGVGCVSLPSYPFKTPKFWVGYKEPRSVHGVGSSQLASASPEYTMLDKWRQYPSKENDFTAIFETPIQNLAGWIRGHSVGGAALCPASVYIEQALAGIRLAGYHAGVTFGEAHPILRQIKFTKPLVYDDSTRQVVVTTISVQNGSGSFTIASRTDSSQVEVTHAHGQYRLQSSAQTATKFMRTFPTISRYTTALLKPKLGQVTEVFSTRTAYEVIFPRVVDYSKSYHAMRSITVDVSSMEGCADVSLPEDHVRGKFVVHPVFMDTLLHVAGFVANLQGGLNDAFICSEVGSVKVIPELVSDDASYMVYCSNAWVPEDEMIVADTYAILATEPRKIVAHIKGMQFRRVRLDRLKRGLLHSKAQASSRPSDSRLPSALSKKEQSQFSRSSVVSYPEPPYPQSTVVDIISHTCGLKLNVTDLDVDLASLGVDSLASIEIYSKLTQAFPEANLSLQVLSFCTTVTDIVREVSAKISRQKLPGVDTPMTLFSGSSTPRTLVSDDLSSDSHFSVQGDPDVKRILSSLLDVSALDIEDDIDFDLLGLDSLTSIEALHILKADFGLDLPSDILNTYHTPRTLQSYLFSRLSETPEPIPDNLPTKHAAAITTSLTRFLKLDTNPLRIQTSSSGQLPLFLIHDGSGLVNHYEHISHLDRPIWGLHNPNFATSLPWGTLVQMAQAYADIIAGLATGPVLLGGWSFGGVVAYEIARSLEKLGHPVRGIILIDSPNPINHVPLSDSLVDHILNLDGRTSSSELGKLVKAQFLMNTSLLRNYHPEPFVNRCPPLVLLRSKEGFNRPGIEVPHWLSTRGDPESSIAGWKMLASDPIKVIDIPGHHFEPFHHSNIREVSMCIAEGCAHLEQMHRG